MRLTPLLLLLAASASTTTAVAQTPQSVVLVELFTSQGCSSCPPADSLLAKLPGLADSSHLILTLSEHVTYWNSLGWQDPFSQDLWTRRQENYAARFRSSETYTPQAVINGTAQALGSDPRAIRKAIDAQTGSDARIEINSVRMMGKQISVYWNSVHLPADAQLYAVIADDRTSTRIPAGENTGRTLMEVTVARTFTHIQGHHPVDLPRSTDSATLDLPPVLADQPPGRHLILFAQSPNQGPVLTATSTAF